MGWQVYPIVARSKKKVQLNKTEKSRRGRFQTRTDYALLKKSQNIVIDGTPPLPRGKVGTRAT